MESKPSKEALEAASEAAAAFSITPEELAEIIDRRFEPLRQRAGQAEARVKELEGERDRYHAAALKILVQSKDKPSDAAEEDNTSLRAANAELQKQEAESRRLFYAEQDKRQSAEFRCEELSGALQVITDLLSKTVKDFGGCDHSVGVCMCEEIRACDNAAEVFAASEQRRKLDLATCKET